MDVSQGSENVPQGCKYEDIIDHHSYAHNLSSCELKVWKKIQDWTAFETMTSVITGAVLYQLSCQANFVMHPFKVKDTS